jgi:hypothetical protein
LAAQAASARERRHRIAAVVDGNVVGGDVVSGTHHRAEIARDIGIFVAQRHTDDRQGLTHTHGPEFAIAAYLAPRHHNAVIAIRPRQARQCRLAATQQVDLDPVTLRGQNFPASVQETLATRRAADFVRGTEDLDDGNKGVRLALANFQACFFDFLVGQEGDGQRFRYRNRLRFFHLLGTFAVVCFFDANIGHTKIAPQIILVRDINAQLDACNVARHQKRI